MTTASREAETARARRIGVDPQTTWIIPVGVALVAIAFVVLTVLRGLPFSPYDEYVYVDYLDKSVTQGIVRAGEEVGTLARAEIECRGVINFGTFGDGCGGGTDADELFPYSGGTGADIYSPVYFWLTNVVAQPLTWLGVGLVDAGRLAGAAWAAIAALAVVGALRALRLHWSFVVATPLVLLATPVAYWSFAFVSTDAAVITTGALLSWLVILRMRGLASAWWLVPVSVVAVLCKLQAVGMVGVALLAVLLHVLLVEGRTGRSLLRGVGGLVATGVLVVAAQVVWLVVRTMAATGDQADLEVGEDEFLLGYLPTQAGIPFLQPGASGAIDSVASALVPTILGFIVPVGVATAVLAIGRRPVPEDRRLLGISVLVVGIALVPAFTVLTYLMLGVFIEPPVRYGATLLPIVLVLVAQMLDDALPPRVGWIVLGASALLAGAMWLV